MTEEELGQPHARKSGNKPEKRPIFFRDFIRIPDEPSLRCGNGESMATAVGFAGYGYPDGFVRAGGARLPLKLRREAQEECIEKTRGIEDAASRWGIIGKIVRKAWDRLVVAGSDVTNFCFDAPSVPVYQDPDARVRARRMLAWVPTTPEFVGCLDQEQAQVWEMSFSTEGHTQVEIAARIGRGQSAVSKILNKAARRLNARYLELREAGQLPLAISAWLKTYVGDDSGEAGLYRVVELLRQRDRARERGRPPVSTGCEQLDGLSIRGN